METQLVIPRSQDPSTIAEILAALRKAHFKPTHESKVWGDWIHLYGCRSVICIECTGGLCTAATLEHGEGEEEGEPVASILQAFGSLGWNGVGEDGEYPLDVGAGMWGRRCCIPQIPQRSAGVDRKPVLDGMDYESSTFPHPMDIPHNSETWPKLFIQLLGRHTLADDAHDPNHIRRVVTNARRLTLAEGADWRVVMPAAWLHDCVAVPKSSPESRNASRLSARQAVAWLESHDWPHGRLDEIAHAIEAHSFSAGVVPCTLEGTMQTPGGRDEARQRTQFIRHFLSQLRDEIASPIS